jgi:hypothetical protein
LLRSIVYGFFTVTKKVVGVFVRFSLRRFRTVELEGVVVTALGD